MKSLEDTREKVKPEQPKEQQQQQQQQQCAGNLAAMAKPSNTATNGLLLPPGTHYLTADTFNAESIGREVLQAPEMVGLTPQQFDNIAKMIVRIADAKGRTVPDPAALDPGQVKITQMFTPRGPAKAEIPTVASPAVAATAVAATAVKFGNLAKASPPPPPPGPAQVIIEPSDGKQGNQANSKKQKKLDAAAAKAEADAAMAAAAAADWKGA